MLNVEFSNRAFDFLKKADIILKERIDGKIEELRADPFPQGVKRVVGEPGKVFRVRVGDYRILYEVYHERNLLFVTKIDKRGNVYD